MKSNRKIETRITIAAIALLFASMDAPAAVADGPPRVETPSGEGAKRDVEEEILGLLEIVRTGYRYGEPLLALHRLLELDPSGERALPVADRWVRGALWTNVYRGQSVFLFYQEKSVLYLLAMMEQRRRVKLTKTQDLIYLGARTFYGHGLIVDYDIDYLPARAGWILEGLAFQDFGFRLDAIAHDAVIAAMQQGKRDVPFNSVFRARESDVQAISEAVTRAHEW